MSNYRHILAATDLSRDAEAVGARAAELARQFGARLTFLHVVEDMPVDIGEDLLVTQPIAIDQQRIEAAKETLGKLAQKLGTTEATTLVELGATTDEIVRVVEEKEVDLLVIGAHSRHGLAVLFHPTARSVLSRCPCDLLAVHLAE